MAEDDMDSDRLETRAGFGEGSDRPCSKDLER